MDTRAVVLLALLLTAPVSAQDIHDPRDCLFGWPNASPCTNDPIIREIYILGSDDLTKPADCGLPGPPGPSEHRS